MSLISILSRLEISELFSPRAESRAPYVFETIREMAIHMDHQLSENHLSFCSSLSTTRHAQLTSTLHYSSSIAQAPNTWEALVSKSLSIDFPSKSHFWLSHRDRAGSHALKSFWQCIWLFKRIPTKLSGLQNLVLEILHQVGALLHRPFLWFPTRLWILIGSKYFT